MSRPTRAAIAPAVRTFEPNPDYDRREALLGLDDPTYPAGLEAVSDLDVERLAMLIDEGFIDPQHRMYQSPSAAEFLGFMRRWPDVLAHGWAPHPERVREPIEIAGLECDLSRVPPHARETLREEFGWLCGDAPDYFDEADYLYASWR